MNFVTSFENGPRSYFSPQQFCRVVSVASQYVRYLLFCNRVKSVNRNDVSSVLRKCYYGDWFILMQLAKHINPAIFHDVVLDLRDKLDAKRAANLQD